MNGEVREFHYRSVGSFTSFAPFAGGGLDRLRSALCVFRFFCFASVRRSNNALLLCLASTSFSFSFSLLCRVSRLRNIICATTQQRNINNRTKQACHSFDLSDTSKKWRESNRCRRLSCSVHPSFEPLFPTKKLVMDDHDNMAVQFRTASHFASMVLPHTFPPGCALYSVSVKGKVR